MYISKAVPKFYLMTIYELCYIGDQWRLIRTRGSERISDNNIDIGGGECVVPLDTLLLASIGIYSCLFRSGITAPVKLEKEQRCEKKEGPEPSIQYWCIKTRI